MSLNAESRPASRVHTDPAIGPRNGDGALTDTATLQALSSSLLLADLYVPAKRFSLRHENAFDREICVEQMGGHALRLELDVVAIEHRPLLSGIEPQ